jgi:predicted short-subunit dehydrogenase-like oxidoreductase (DUF2520 family)
MRIALLGSGNVATHLGHALKKAGEDIVQVYSRNAAHASALAGKLNASAVNDPAQVTSEADIYIIAVNDDAILSVASLLPRHNGLVVHTSGSTDMEVLQNTSGQIGVLYPLQTFSKEKTVDFREVPLAVEGNSEHVLQILSDLAGRISGRFVLLDSEQRRALHIAAVFACNFTNHLYSIAAGLLHDYDLDFDLLRPLIRETSDKVQSYMPAEVQTGPAVRGDEQTMLKHLELLKGNPRLRQLYEDLSQSIVNLPKQGRSSF